MIFRNLTSVGMKTQRFSLENRYASLHCSLHRLPQGIVFNLNKHYSQVTWFCLNVADMNDKVKKDILQCNKVTKLLLLNGGNM